MKKLFTFFSVLFCAAAVYSADKVVADWDDVIPSETEWGIWGSPEITAKVETPVANATGDAMLLTTTANNSGNSGFWLTCNAAAGTYNILNFKIKSETNPCKFYIKLEYNNNGTKETKYSSWPQYNTAGGVWQDFNIDITGMDVSSLVIQLAPWQNAAAFSCYLDNVTLKASTGIHKQNAEGISVFKAENADFIQVNLDKNQAWATIKVYSAEGKLLLDRQTRNQSEQIDVNDLKAVGLVFVDVITASGNSKSKVIIK